MVSFKISTKEKFHVIAVQNPALTANMAVELQDKLYEYLDISPCNVILVLTQVEKVDLPVLLMLSELKTLYYENNTSFVVCCANAFIHNLIQSEALDEAINYVPTESEAYDIVQMDEIERDFEEDIDAS